MILAVSNSYFTRTKRRTEIELTPLERELQTFFVACKRSDATLMIATRRATVDMTVKWRLNPRK
jgi:hypothetical protein